MRRLTLFLFFFLSFLVVVNAQEETPNARQARRIFNTAYERVFGPQGASLHYNVNIIGIYKTEGTISFKEKKQRFTDERVDVWNDGVTAYMAYRKKRIVEVHQANSDKKDKYSGRFKFSLDDFDYSVANNPEGLMLTLKQKKKAKGTIKEVKALVERGSYAPKKLRIKVAFIWTTVLISDFKSGGISDNLFVFPHEKFKEGWNFVDKR